VPWVVSASSIEITVDVRHSNLDSVLRASVLGALAQPVVEPRAVEGVAEVVVGRLDTGARECAGFGRADELSAVELLEDHVLGELIGVDIHDVDPVVENPRRIGRIGTQHLAVGPRDALFKDDR